MAINYLAILVAALASFVFGAIYYGILGKQWMASRGMTDAEIGSLKTEKKMPIGPMITCIVAQLLMAFMLSGMINHLTGGAPTMRAGLISAGLSWLGFSITTSAVNNAFQNKKIMLTVIDGGHWLVVLLIQGVIIGQMP